MARGLAEWDRAIQAFEARVTSELPAASPPVASQMRATLAAMYLERGRLTDALREIEGASRLEPKRADLHLFRARLLDASARSAEAGEAFRAAWATDSSNPITAYYFLHRSAGPPEGGPYEDATRARETLSAAYQRLVRESAPPKAAPFSRIGLFQEVAKEELVIPPAAYAPGYALISRGEYSEAIAEFRRAAAIDPLLTDPAAGSASMTNAVAALRQGRLADARAVLESAPGLRDSSEAHRVLGLIYWAGSQHDKSIEQLEIAVQRNPRDERSRLALARVIASTGRDQDAQRILQDAIQVLPDSALARSWLGSGFQRLNRPAEARQEFERAVSAAIDGRATLYALIGQLASASADLPAAVDAFTHAVAERPSDRGLRKELASALLRQDRPEDAFVELVAVLLIDPLDADAHTGIGQIHLNAGRYTDAVTALRRAVELSANHTAARYALASALMRSGSTREAAQELERVEQAQRQALDDRRRTMALDVLKEEAAFHAAEGRYERAVALYERALTSGADPSVYRELAVLYAKVGRIEEATRARDTYEKAMQGLPARGAR
jgi:tetratricopeptide (TPR) repeat protein